MKSTIFIFIFFITDTINAEDCGAVLMTQWANTASLWTTPLSNPVDMVIMQHTVTPEGASADECKNLMIAIRTYHKETMQFDDVGESFLICGNGKVYEGAGWGLVGAHTRSYNSKSIGIAFIGDFGEHLPTPAAIKAAQDLIACGVTNNHLTSDYKLVGHRQVTDTISPGDALQKEIESWPHWTGSP